jgi:hypothetical protein
MVIIGVMVLMLGGITPEILVQAYIAIIMFVAENKITLFKLWNYE